MISICKPRLSDRTVMFENKIISILLQCGVKVSFIWVLNFRVSVNKKRKILPHSANNNTIREVPHADGQIHVEGRSGKPNGEGSARRRTWPLLNSKSISHLQLCLGSIHHGNPFVRPFRSDLVERAPMDQPEEVSRNRKSYASFFPRFTLVTTSYVIRSAVIPICNRMHSVASPAFRDKLPSTLYKGTCEVSAGEGARPWITSPMLITCT